MANTSIKAAFEQFWKHVIARTGDMISTANTYADSKLEEAKSYTDTKTSGFASESDITSGISNHNSSSSAHSDIRTLISNLSSAVDGKRAAYTATLGTGWTGSGPYTQTVAVSGILATDMPHITPVYDAANATAIAQKEAWNCVSKAEAAAGGIKFTCFENKPTTAIPIQVEVMR